MKIISSVLVVAAALSATSAVVAQATSTPTGANGPRIGVYDSRAVAFAWFWSVPARTERDAVIATAQTARAAGDTQRLDEYQQAIKAGQDRIHLEIFSTAPADEAMAALKDKLPALQRELGVARLVSLWDEAALKPVPASNRVDVTARLVQEFNLDEKRQKTIQQMLTTPPLPLTEARQLLAAGKL